MARQQEDIQGFRRSHKKIPTRQAMLDDQEELKNMDKDAIDSLRSRSSQRSHPTAVSEGEPEAMQPAGRCPRCQPEGLASRRAGGSRGTCADRGSLSSE